MQNNQKIIALFLTIITVFFFWGCAEKSKELLAENYKIMNNEELLRYFYSLNDEIEHQEKQHSPQVSFGLGGSGRSSSVGGVVGAGSAGSGYSAKDLKERRIDIRMELKKRGLTP